MGILNKNLLKLIKVKIMYYINIFFIYSFIGFLFESVVTSFNNSTFNSGVLYGPWTFIYGIAIFILIWIFATLCYTSVNIFYMFKSTYDAIRI